ncbi:MAG: transcription antitermination factor NusB [Clostridia bacterium]|nr:transcription antitermination factor NusB [Clostridia bacterium]
MTRKEARDAVFTLLYEYEFQRELTPDEVFAVSVENREIDVEADAYITAAFNGVCENRDALDAKIAEFSGKWKPERMSRISRTILRLATYELTAMPDIPFSVVINEAIELSKRYEGDRAPAFVNGILNAIAKQHNEAAE